MGEKAPKPKEKKKEATDEVLAQTVLGVYT